MNQPAKRKPGRPRKNPLPDNQWGERVNHNLPSDAMSSLAGTVLGDPDADAREKSLAGALLALDDVRGTNEPEEPAHDQDEEHAVADEAEREDSGAGEVSSSGKINAVCASDGNDLPQKDGSDRIQGNELTAMQREAWEAFDYQESRGKTDTLGRIWGFEPEVRNGNTVVTFSLRRSGGERLETVISTAQYGVDGAREMSDAMVVEMNGWAV